MCKISGCSTPAVAHGLCAKHYMRQRRHGDPTVTRPPGVDLAAWRKKVAALERALKQAQATAKPSVSCTACVDKDWEIAALNQQAANEAIVRSVLQERIAGLEKKAANAKRGADGASRTEPPPMPRTAAELAQAKLRAEEERKALREARRAAARAAKPMEIPDDKTKEEYERQIKSLLTQLRNKRITIAKLVENIDMGKAMIFASAADRRFILAHFHPDRFKPDKKAQAERVFQLLNNMPVIDR